MVLPDCCYRKNGSTGGGAILHDLLQNVCISALKALLVTMSGAAVNSNAYIGKKEVKGCAFIGQ